MTEPQIIQGGMGVGVSSWQLANAVARRGQLGVVSGTAVAVTEARRLMSGDPGGHVRWALSHFPDQGIVRRILDRYYVPDRRPRESSFRGVPRFTLDPRPPLLELTVAANFVQVFLAKQGHDGPVGINYLEKIQLPTLPSLYGAMLAGVDYVLMGAGVPARIPALLDRLAQHQAVSLPVSVSGTDAGEQHVMDFDPVRTVAHDLRPLRRPRFLAIVSSATLATFLARQASGAPDGFVVETPVAGGHNAPPRGRLTLSPTGEPVYGPRDAIKLDAIAELGLPFWLAGGYGRPDRLRAALADGAAGVQVGTAFAFCEESGLDDGLKAAALKAALAGQARVRTDPQASPTGFPFKVLDLDGTLSDPVVYASRPRRCDLGYLREAYRRDDGTVGYRCPAEPVDDYVMKGGDPEDTHGRQCLCNALVADIGLPQRRHDGYVEPPLLTAGDDVTEIGRFLPAGRTSYSAADVIDHLLDLSLAGRPTDRHTR